MMHQQYKQEKPLHKILHLLNHLTLGLWRLMPYQVKLIITPQLR